MTSLETEAGEKRNSLQLVFATRTTMARLVSQKPAQSGIKLYKIGHCCVSFSCKLEWSR